MGDFLTEILDGRKRRSKRSKKDRKKFRQMFKSWMAAKKEAAVLKKRIGGPGARGSKKDKEFRRNRAIWADAKSKAVEARKAYFAKIRAYRKRDEVVDAVRELVEILDGRRKRRSKKDRKKFRQMFRSWFNAWMAAKKEAAGLKKRIGGPGARGSKKRQRVPKKSSYM